MFKLLLAFLVPLVTVLSSVSSPAVAALARYDVDAQRSRLFVMVFKDPDALGAKLSHDHVVRARAFSADIAWDPKAPDTCEVSFVIQVAGLDPDPPSLRKRVGLKRMLTASDRAQVKENLLDQSQLWGAKHPTIRFTATTCARRGGQVDVTGSLTLRGVTRQVTAPMTLGIDVGTGELTASGSLTIRHTWFGFKPYSALGGALRNRDEMRLVIVVRGARATP
ncbi:MAG: YceI family protein [Myxococcota bacterium]